MTGQLVQTSNLTGAWGENAARAGDMYGDMQGNMGTGFNDRFSAGLDTKDFGVNSAVMDALRAQMHQVSIRANAADRARAAAMGSGYGSGAANMAVEDQIGRNNNDMEQKAILAGNQAWLSGQGNLRQNAASDLGIWNSQQANNRANMGALMSGVTGMDALANQDPWGCRLHAADVAGHGGDAHEQDVGGADGAEQDRLETCQRHEQQLLGQPSRDVGQRGRAERHPHGISKVKNWWDTPSTSSPGANEMDGYTNINW